MIQLQDVGSGLLIQEQLFMLLQPSDRPIRSALLKELYNKWLIEFDIGGGTKRWYYIFENRFMLANRIDKE